VKFIKTESRMWAASCWESGVGEGRLMSDGDRISVLQDEKTSGDGGGCTTLWTNQHH
jgi:hypothetical protein